MILLDIIVGATPTEPLKIEVGKFYRTRSGQKVRIYATDGGGYCGTHGAVLTKGGWVTAVWTEGGSINSDKFRDNFDIVSEWKDEVEFDFSILPPWIHFIAMEADGAWWGYARVLTTQYAGSWCNDCEDVEPIRIPQDYAPKWVGGWRDSLTKRK